MMVQEITFVVCGPVIPWKRAQQTKTNRIDGRGTRMYKHPSDLNYQKKIAFQCSAALTEWVHQSGEAWNGSDEFALEVVAFLQDKKTRDWDNIGKQVSDALNGICWNDDVQVVDGRTIKRIDRKRPRIHITIRRVHGYLDEGSGSIEEVKET